MLVRFTARWWQAVTPATGHEYAEGQEINLSDDVARAAIAAGVAEPVADDAPAPAEDDGA